MFAKFKSDGRAARGIGALLVMAACAAVAGCDNGSSDATVGQKVDAAIDKTRDVAADVRTEAKAALGDAEARYKHHTLSCFCGTSARDFGENLDESSLGTVSIRCLCAQTTGLHPNQERHDRPRRSLSS